MRGVKGLNVSFLSILLAWRCILSSLALRDLKSSAVFDTDVSVIFPVSWVPEEGDPERLTLKFFVDGRTLDTLTGISTVQGQFAYSIDDVAFEDVTGLQIQNITDILQYKIDLQALSFSDNQLLAAYTINEGSPTQGDGSTSGIITRTSPHSTSSMSAKSSLPATSSISATPLSNSQFQASRTHTNNNLVPSGSRTLLTTSSSETIHNGVSMDPLSSPQTSLPNTEPSPTDSLVDPTQSSSALSTRTTVALPCMCGIVLGSLLIDILLP